MWVWAVEGDFTPKSSQFRVEGHWVIGFGSALGLSKFPAEGQSLLQVYVMCWRKVPLRHWAGHRLGCYAHVRFAHGLHRVGRV